ncbi:LL-diaminopimelate aminotransferase [Feifania hominis]|uniref:LL-diaminopimelate aminotransferase n=1 Tax=Feifania hominis TaxID=2763660 RepID=A0A926HTU6_9FIRM|nr:LL-diaminopimelate aminotransferase [Feifania hominis]MBC8536224.1 LL-diaminopimelate aminotransferase [Feifania hominis]
MKINENYLKLQDSYLFSTIARKVASYTAAHPERTVIRLGIGDVTRPLCPAVVRALEEASREMGTPEGFHGYGPEQGYDFLREAVALYYSSHGVTLSADEIYISDGAKSDLGNILDLFDADNRVLIPDPVYPVYVDTNIMAGREIVFLDANASNGFLPMPDDAVQADLIYLCSPNNPTGAVYNHAQLKAWVDYALQTGAVILFDAAYECFVGDGLPHSIFEIEGARGCAIEFCSLSKTAGFTGTRCGYTVVPHELRCAGVSLGSLWLRRQTTKFNGVPYIVQRGAAAVFSPEGRREIEENLRYYRDNARIMADVLREMGVWFTGGAYSPYLWLRCPRGLSSWEYFDQLLEQANVVGTPGAGFGRNGEGYFRLTAFGERGATVEAMERIRKMG